MTQAAHIPFRFELPFEVFHKAGAKGKERRIGGIISTDKTDRQGEVVLNRGLDFSEFLTNGWFNDNHSKETAGIVGYPESVKKVTHRGKPAHYVEGYLLEGHAPSDKIWSLANALQKTGRRLGFSIEGAVTQRDNNGLSIAEAKVRNVAVTNCPVNTDTGLEVLAKSMVAIEQSSDQIYRSMMAGQAVNPPPAASGEGSPLRTESMGQRPRRRKQKQKLTKAEAVEFLREYPGMDLAKAERILSYIAARTAS